MTQVQLKLAWSVAEASNSKSQGILDVAPVVIANKKDVDQTSGCADWSATLLFTYGICCLQMSRVRTKPVF